MQFTPCSNGTTGTSDGETMTTGDESRQLPAKEGSLGEDSELWNGADVSVMYSCLVVHGDC